MSEIVISRSIARYAEQGEPLHCWTATLDGAPVSWLWVSTDNLEIVNVETHREHQGYGYASALYRQAATEIDIHHAPESHRTPDGNRFARSVGGPAVADCLKDCCNRPADFDDEDEDDLFGDDEH